MEKRIADNILSAAFMVAECPPGMIAVAFVYFPEAAQRKRRDDGKPQFAVGECIDRRFSWVVKQVSPAYAHEVYAEIEFVPAGQEGKCDWCSTYHTANPA